MRSHPREAWPLFQGTPFRHAEPCRCHTGQDVNMVKDTNMVILNNAKDLVEHLPPWFATG